MEPLFLRVNEAASILGFARTTVYKLIREKRIPATKIGLSIRIPYGALKKFAEAQEDTFDTPTPRPKLMVRNGPAERKAERKNTAKQSSAGSK